MVWRCLSLGRRPFVQVETRIVMCVGLREASANTAQTPSARGVLYARLRNGRRMPSRMDQFWLSQLDHALR